MSLEIIEAGLFESIQDAGRFGFQHQGINPTGAMDNVAMQVANMLVGNKHDEAVLEVCFPAAVIKFNSPVLLAVNGADFGATMNGSPVPLRQPILVSAQSVLKFEKWKHGRFCFVAVQGGFEIPEWLSSKSTHTKAEAGGWKGRSLKKGDCIPVKKLQEIHEVKILPWRANIRNFYSRTNTIRCVKGNEFEWLDKKSRVAFTKQQFAISAESDRMGYRLSGSKMKYTVKEELISTAVTFGTVQLLPNGQLIVLCADHQTTGGYPRVATVIAADRSRFVQMKMGSEFDFEFVTIEEAEQALLVQDSWLRKLNWSCKMKLQGVIR